MYVLALEQEWLARGAGQCIAEHVANIEAGGVTVSLAKMWLGWCCVAPGGCTSVGVVSAEMPRLYQS